VSAHDELPRYPKPEAVIQIPEYGHAVIEASAGTGKTHTIEHLVVDLIAGGTRIDEILVVTFTERATAELKRRIRARMRALVTLERTETELSPENCWVMDEATRDRLGAALVDFDSASIATLHGFCYSVLVDNAFLNGSFFDERHVDARAAFSRAFKETLRSEITRSQELLPYLLAWLRVRPSSVEALEELLFEASRQRASLHPSFDPKKLANAAWCFEDVATSSSELLKAGVPRGSIAKVLRNIERVSAAHTAYRETNDIAALVAKLDDVELTYLTGQLRGFEELASASSSLSSAVVARFLPVVLERLERIKREEGVFDFDDMLRRVARSLEGPRGTELAELLQSRFRYVLIDEFQDTDDTQWEIFRKLFFAGGAKTPLRLVGDPKQAIYAFRGADVHVYLEARAALVARSAMVPLVENFRSTSELIDALNLVLDQKAEPPFFTGNIRYDRPVRAARPELKLIGADGQPAFPLILLRSDTAKPIAAHIAREIRALLSDETKQLRFGKEGSERPIGPEDIFVLTRTGKQARQVGDALAEQGVPYAFYKQEGFFQTREAEDVVDLLTALLDLRNRSNRLRAWMTPFFGVSLRDLERCGAVASDHPLMQRLIDWKSLADAREYERLFEGILNDSGVLLREVFAGNGDRALVNYEQLFDTLLEEAYETAPSLPELLRTLRGFIDESGLMPGSDRNVMRLARDRTVQVMTIHGAKGLEAAVVFVYALSNVRSRGVHTFYERAEKRAYVGKLSEAPKAVGEAIERERREEDQRLLYVALTRAKARLYLPLLPDEAAGLGCYDRVNRRLHELLGVFRIDEVRADVPAADAPVTGIDGWTPPAELLVAADTAPKFDALRQRHRGLVVTSYTRLKSLRGGYRAPIEEPADLADIDLPGGSATGVFLHEVLEKVPLDSFRSHPTLEQWRLRDDVASVLQRAMRRNGIDACYRPEAERIVHTALTSPVTLGDKRLDGGFASVTSELREVEFIYPYPEADGKLRRGFAKGYIDFVFEHSGMTYVCDWKSDVLASYARDALSEHARRNYGIQAKLYTLAILKMLEVVSEEDYLARFGGIVYCFVRGLPAAGVHYERPTWAIVTQWRDELVRETTL
jgi:exodeoxyribonuclease V beta subunit